MSSPPTLEVLDVQVQTLIKDVDKIKEKIEKDTENNTVIREAIVKLSILMEKQDERNEKQEQRMDQQDEKLDEIAKEIQTIKVDISDKGDTSDVHTTWYQNFITDSNKRLWYVLLLVLCAVLGYKADDIIGLLL